MMHKLESIRKSQIYSFELSVQNILIKIALVFFLKTFHLFFKRKISLCFSETCLGMGSQTSRISAHFQLFTLPDGWNACTYKYHGFLNLKKGINSD